MTTTERSTSTSVFVFVDSDTDRTVPLRASALDGRWNGFVVPIVTATEFSRWLTAMALNDSEWLESTSSATSYSLTYVDENGIDQWDSIGTDEHDNELFALDGWAWVL